MKAEFSKLTFSEQDADKTVAAHPDWFVGAHMGDERTGHLDYYGRQQIGVHIATPTSGAGVEKGIVIIPRSYQDAFAPAEHGRFDLETKRDQVIANVLGKVVVGVDTPGFGLNPDVKRNSLQIGASLTGSMAPHSRAQLEAIRDALKQQGLYDAETDKQLLLELIGYSMGNIAVTDMLAQTSILGKDVRLAQLTHVEAVNDQTHGLLGRDGLLPAIGREMSDDVMNRYLAQNARNGLGNRYDRMVDDYSQRDIDRDERMRRAIGLGNLTNLPIGAGMWRGWAPRLIDELKRPTYSGTKIRLLRTNGSQVARERQNTETTLQIADLGLDSAMYTVHPGENEVDHRHPIWQSLPATAALIHEVHHLTDE